MNYRGHTGLGLLFTAPIAVAVGLLTHPAIGLLAFITGLAGGHIPDACELPGMSHRGVTHTLIFGIFVSIALAFSIIQGAQPLTKYSQIPVSPLILGVITFVSMLVGFISHLFGDALTEAYDYTVNPYWPLSDTAYTLSWTTHDSSWNEVFLIAGIIATLAATVILVSLP